MFKGIYTPTITIFDDKGEIDIEANILLIEKLISEGVDGIVILGSIGEFFNLSFNEKKEYIKFVTTATRGRTKVIVGTGSNNIKEVLELNQFSKECGADAVLVITPYFFNLDEKYIYEYYSTIANNTELQMVIYNFPARTGTNLSADLVLKLATEYENIVGIKDSTDSMSNIRKFAQKIKMTRKDFAIISGFDEYLIPNLMSGGDGIIGGLTNINAKLFIDTYKAFLKKDYEKLSIFQDKINILMELYDVTNPFIVAIKEATAMSLQTEFNTTLRNYSIEVGSDEREKIKSIINAR